MASLIFFLPISILRRFSLVRSVSTGLLLIGCDGDDPTVARSQYLGGVYGNEPVSSAAPKDSVSYWDGDSVSGKPSIKISLGEQKAYFYKGGQLVGISQLSTGREGMGTTTGTFKFIQKDQTHVASQYGDYVDSADNVVVANVDVVAVLTGDVVLIFLDDLER